MELYPLYEEYEEPLLDLLHYYRGDDEPYSCVFCDRLFQLSSCGHWIGCIVCRKTCCPRCAYIANNLKDLNNNAYNSCRTPEKIHEATLKLSKENIKYLGNRYYCPNCYYKANPEKYVLVTDFIKEIVNQNRNTLTSKLKGRELIKDDLENLKRWLKKIPEFLIVENSDSSDSDGDSNNASSSDY